MTEEVIAFAMMSVPVFDFPNTGTPALLIGHGIVTVSPDFA